MPGAADRSLPSGTLTLLFTDIEGSTRLVQELGDRWPSLLEDHRRMLREVWSAHRGVEVGTEGDSFFVAFERARDALAAAREAQRVLGAHDWRGTPIRVRMGMHSGEADLVDGDYAGFAVHLAARVAAAAHGGQVLLSEATVALTSDPAVRDLGHHRLKDIDSTVRLFQLLGDDLPSEFPPVRTLGAPNNLPAPVDEFIGREREMGEVVAATERSRLVTLIGPGGTGKTRLAVEVARRLAATRPHGVWFVELGVTVDPEQVDALVARAIGVVERTGRTVRDSLLDTVRDQELLLVLDNCEHVIDRVADLTAALLAGSPRTTILATSRERLGVRGEQTLAVPPLGAHADPAGPSDAVRLFVARGRAVRPDFDPDDLELALIADICDRIDGLPLGIELAAARLRTLSVEQLSARLDDGFRLLASQERGVPSRQQTMEAVVRWSYQLLTPDEQTLFARLSVFRDAFGLDAAEAVCAGGPIQVADVLDLLSRLADKSLVTAVPAEAGIRYQLLAVLRSFGARELEKAGDADARNDALAAWALDQVSSLEAAMRSPRQDEALRRVRPDHANIRAALDWMLERGDEVGALRTVTSVPIGVPSERLELIDALLARIPDAAPAVRGRALLACANLNMERGADDEAHGAAVAAEVALEEAGLRDQATWARFFQVHPSWSAGDLATVDRLCGELLEEFCATGSQLGVAYVSWIASLRSTDLARAETLAQAACDEFRSIGADFGLAHALEGRALVLVRADRAHDALPFVDESLRLFARAGNAGCLAHSLEAVAACLAATGSLRQVAELSGAAEAFREATGHSHRPWELRGAEEALAALPVGEREVDACRARGRTHSLSSATERALAFLEAAAASRRS